jgi:hypothetical protein
MPLFGQFAIALELFNEKSLGYQLLVWLCEQHQTAHLSGVSYDCIFSGAPDYFQSLQYALALALIFLMANKNYIKRTNNGQRIVFPTHEFCKHQWDISSDHERPAIYR